MRKKKKQAEEPIRNQPVFLGGRALAVDTVQKLLAGETVTITDTHGYLDDDLLAAIAECAQRNGYTVRRQDLRGGSDKGGGEDGQ